MADGPMYDVIIIGAGPSGSLAAYQLSHAGYKVLMIEKKKSIGFPVQCGEATTLSCLHHCDISPDDTWVKNTMKGCKIILSKNYYFYSSAPWINIDRGVFDQYLANRACSQGCTLLTKTKMNDLQRKNGQWKVFTNNGIYASQVVIGADGPLSITARKGGFLQKKGTYVRGFQYKFDAKDISFSDKDWLHMCMDPSLKGGYQWVFPRDDEYNVGIGGFSINLSHLNEFCTSLGIDYKKKKMLSGGLLPFGFEFTTRSKLQCCLIGDAAGMVNPSTGAGIHAGMMSGLIAADTIINAFEKNDMTFIDRYDKEILKTPFLHPIHQKTVSYFLKWTTHDWSKLGKATHRQDMADLSLIKSFIIGLRNPSLFLKSKELLTIRKSMRMNREYS